MEFIFFYNKKTFKVTFFGELNSYSQLHFFGGLLLYRDTN